MKPNLYLWLKLQFMEVKKKSNAGRKPLPAKERLTIINIFVKKKHLAQARIECAAIANKYR